MARDLETLKEKLWDAFDHASGNRSKAASAGWDIHNGNMKAIAQLGAAIVALESEQRAQAEAQNKLPSAIKKPAN